MNPFAEVTESIVEHAEAIARLDPARTAGRVAVEEHVHAIRVLALPHIGAAPDRAFFKALQRTAQRTGTVFVHMPEGVIEFLVDTRGPQVRFELWTARQMREGA